jgi:hypothetical protein
MAQLLLLLLLLLQTQLVLLVMVLLVQPARVVLMHSSTWTFCCSTAGCLWPCSCRWQSG